MVKPFILRRLKRDVLKELPDKNRESYSFKMEMNKNVFITPMLKGLSITGSQRVMMSLKQAASKS